MGSTESSRTRTALERERWRILGRLEGWLETPMIVLAFVWLALLVMEFVQGETRWLLNFGTAIWIIFSIDFLLRFFIAPSKKAYFKRNWLTALSLIVPALRVFRVFAALRVIRAARLARGLRLLRVLSSVNRSMRALSATMRRRGFGYVVALTLVVTFAGAAGMLAFERDYGLSSYGQALWWTAMIITTMGTDFWPHTTEGRVLCLFLAIYAFAVFGYVTATIATFFIGRDAESGNAEIATGSALASLQREVAALRQELRSTSRR